MAHFGAYFRKRFPVGRKRKAHNVVPLGRKLFPQGRKNIVCVAGFFRTIVRGIPKEQEGLRAGCAFLFFRNTDFRIFPAQNEIGPFLKVFSRWDFWSRIFK